MPRRIEKRERGVYEKEPGSDIWWIRYKVDGTLHREKVGRRGDAIKLYKVRKTDALRGVKLPVNLKQRGIRFRVIGDEAVAWYENHGQKDLRTFKLRMDMILRDFADRLVEEIKPSDIDTWLGSHDWAPATKNRYKSVFSKAFKLALADGKVSGNPARLVQQRPEKNARMRFLSAEEEKRLRDPPRSFQTEWNDCPEGCRDPVQGGHRSYRSKGETGVCSQGQGKERTQARSQTRCQGQESGVTFHASRGGEPVASRFFCAQKSRRKTPLRFLPAPTFPLWPGPRSPAARQDDVPPSCTIPLRWPSALHSSKAARAENRIFALAFMLVAHYADQSDSLDLPTIHPYRGSCHPLRRR